MGIATSAHLEGRNGRLAILYDEIARKVQCLCDGSAMSQAFLPQAWADWSVQEDQEFNIEHAPRALEQTFLLQAKACNFARPRECMRCALMVIRRSTIQRAKEEVRARQSLQSLLQPCCIAPSVISQVRKCGSVACAIACIALAIRALCRQLLVCWLSQA